MKTWDTNELRQPTSSLSPASYLLNELFYSQKSWIIFTYLFLFETEYSSKSWHLLQEYLVVFFDYKSLVAAIQL